jgi:lipopolysaccharide assembly outer membrane protein LptD (OstA)
VSSRWVPLVKFTADLKAKKVTERLFGVEYRSSCWVFRVAYHLYPSSGGVSRRNIFFQLSLDGLGGVGKSPLSTFKTSVLGYQPLEGERALPRKGLWYEN